MIFSSLVYGGTEYDLDARVFIRVDFKGEVDIDIGGGVLEFMDIIHYIGWILPLL